MKIAVAIIALLFSFACAVVEWLAIYFLVKWMGWVP